MYLQFLDNEACISWEIGGNASKYFCSSAEILRNCSPSRSISECKIREGYIIAARYIPVRSQRRVITRCNSTERNDVGERKYEYEDKCKLTIFNYERSDEENDEVEMLELCDVEPGKILLKTKLI